MAVLEGNCPNHRIAGIGEDGEMTKHGCHSIHRGLLLLDNSGNVNKSVVNAFRC